MYNDDKNSKDKKCAVKVDLMKAYKSMNWNFIFSLLKCIELHPKFIRWIKSYITSSLFSMIINGELVGFFRSQTRRSIIPYLFVMSTKILSCMLDKLKNKAFFGHNWKCKANNITHLCFKDSLILFYTVAFQLVQCFKRILDNFQRWLDLCPNDFERTFSFQESQMVKRSHSINAKL